MKKLRYFIPIVLLGFILACTAETGSENHSDDDAHTTNTTTPETNDKDQQNSTADTMKDIELTLTPDSFTAGEMNTATLKVSNNSADSLAYGERYYIEQKDGGNWTKIEPLSDIAYDDIAYNLTEGESQESTVLLKQEDYTYQSGTYRICKNFTSNGGEKNACTEFTVE